MRVCSEALNKFFSVLGLVLCCCFGLGSYCGFLRSVNLKSHSVLSRVLELFVVRFLCFFGICLVFSHMFWVGGVGVPIFSIVGILFKFFFLIRHGSTGLYRRWAISRYNKRMKRTTMKNLFKNINTIFLIYPPAISFVISTNKERHWVQIPF